MRLTKALWERRYRQGVEFQGQQEYQRRVSRQEIFKQRSRGGESRNLRRIWLQKEQNLITWDSNILLTGEKNSFSINAE